MAKVSIVIPVYFNEQSLPLLFSELLKVEGQLVSLGHSLELIFVDDGSGDNSLNELLRIKQQRPDVRVVKLTRNFGAVHASRSGLKFVTGDCFLILAADLQDPPELIIQMLEKWQAGTKFVMCARTERNDPLASKLFAYIYYRLLRWFVVPNYPRGGFDLALMDRALLPYLQDSAKNINPLVFSYWLGFKPEIIPYRRQERKFGKSRWSFGKKFVFFIDSILGFSIVPLRAISLVGVVVSLLSFAYGCLIFVGALLGRAEVRGFATIVALISFLLGLVIIMLGIIGEYLWRVFDEANKRPGAVIEDIY
jgi:dolichol-phosphate mannosyltransferase